MRAPDTRRPGEPQVLQDTHAHALLLQVQQLTTRRHQRLDEALREAAQLALELSGAQTAAIVVDDGSGQLLRSSAGPLDAAPAGGPPRQECTLTLQAGDTGLGTLQLWSAPGARLGDGHLDHLHLLAGSLAAMVELRRVDAQLRASEQQYRALFSEHAQPMWVCEQGSLRLLAVNRAMVRQYGWSEDELLAMDMRALWPAAQQDAVDDAVARAAHTRAPTLWRHARKGGLPLDMEVVLGATHFRERPAWQVLASDVTERCRAEAELARITRARRMRSACSQLLLHASTEQEFLDAVCRAAVETGGYALAWVGMARNDAARTIDIVAHAGRHAEILQRLQLTWSHLREPGRGPAGKVVRSGQAVILRNLRNLRAPGSVHPYARELTQLGFQAVVCLPLKNGDHTFGLLYLYAPQALQAGSEETQLLQALAADLSFGIHSLRARAEQQHLQSALLRVATAVSAGTGAQFFDQLAEHMAQALHAQVACVAWLAPQAGGQGARMRTLSHVSGGQVQPRAEYPLAGTPSRHLLAHRQYVVADHVAQLYPQSGLVARMRAYVGQQLTGGDGQLLGLMFVAFDQALEQSQLVVHMLQIFAARASAELQRQQADARIRRQASLLDNARDAIIVRDLEQRVTYWNQGAERLYGWRSSEALGHPVVELLQLDGSAYARADAAVLERGDWSGETQQRDRAGRPLEIESRWTLVRGDGGEPEAVLAINSDISQRKANEREIERLAFFDPLTQLPNRLQLFQRMGSALIEARESGTGGALLYIDLDNFKTLNDTLGHDKGDQLLQRVAQRLKACARPQDTVARLGGDEFVLLASGLEGDEQARTQVAHALGARTLAALAEPYELHGYQVRSTPSMGIALFDGNPASVGELLKQADMAMYQAKTAGRNTLRFFDPAMERAVAERAQLEADLRAALAQGEFLLMYQPMVDGSGRVLGVEALVRWAHPRRGMVSPAEFIALAEETGLIVPLGQWVLGTACALLAAWHQVPALAHLTMAVNVSPRQFRDPGFVRDVTRVLARTAAPARQLKLELTEGLLVEDVPATIATMEALCELGVGFSLDDFGTGYSSLAYLKRMPLERLKIDQSFVRDLLLDASDAAIVKTIIALAASLDLQVIAEGVETREQRDWLLAAGCPYFQGFLFSRPLPPDQLERLALQGSVPLKGGTARTPE